MRRRACAICWAMPEMTGSIQRMRKLLETSPREVIDAVRQHLASNPRDTEALRIAAAAHRALGERDFAERAEIAAIDAAKDLPEIAQATHLNETGEFGRAGRIIAEYLQRHPHDLAALTLSAESATALGLPGKAIPLLESVLARAPSYLLARTLLIEALLQVDRIRDARALIDPIVRRMPETLRFQRLAAQVAARQGRFEEASSASAIVARLDPQAAENWIYFGDTLRFGGRRDEAIAAYREALAVQPSHGRAWWSLTDIEVSAISGDDEAAMERAVGELADDAEQLCNLQFAQAIVADKQGNHARAFAQFTAGNETRRTLETDDPGLISAQVDRYLASAAIDTIPPLAEASAESPVPIFIIGMPRSGSTLVERALGRHSQIEALGELPIVPHMVERIGRNTPDGDVVREIDGLPPERLAAMGQWYLARSAEVAKSEPPARYRTDKMHMNWRHLPLILRMLPQARVIDLRRGAMDCCWSNYRTLFARGHPASHDLHDIGVFYRDYVRLSDALRARAPSRIRLVRYEEMVGDFDTGMQALLEWLDLPFEPQVVDFHLSPEPVATASSEQVRRPLNRDGIGAWRPYAGWLGPLRDALGDLAED